MYDPNPPPPSSQQQQWWEDQSGRPPLTPEQQAYYGDWVAQTDALAEQMGPHRVSLDVFYQNYTATHPQPVPFPQNFPQNYPSGPVNTDPTTGGGTGEFTGGRGSSRPLGSGLARRPGQPQQGQPRPPGQFQKVQAQPRHVLRQAALQQAKGGGKATSTSKKAGSLPFKARR